MPGYSASHITSKQNMCQDNHSQPTLVQLISMDLHWTLYQTYVQHNNVQHNIMNTITN